MPNSPLFARSGSIRPYQNNASEHFIITWNALGKRQRESRASLDATKLRAEEIATAISNGEIGATELNSANRDSHRHALGLLDPLGIPLHAAVEEFIAARNIPDSDSLTCGLAGTSRHHRDCVKSPAFAMPLHPIQGRRMQPGGKWEHTLPACPLRHPAGKIRRAAGLRLAF